MEGTANGQILIDGSVAGIGQLQTPVLLTIENGICSCCWGGSTKIIRNVVNKPTIYINEKLIMENGELK